MITVKGTWYNGKHSSQTAVILRAFDNGAIRVELADTGEVLIRQNKLNARISARLAETPRYLTFTDGSVLETDNNQAVDQLLKKMKSGNWMQWVHLLESKKRYILISSLFVLLIGAVLVKYGFPMAAKIIAAQLPQSIFNTADHQVLDTLDRIIFKPSELPLDIQNRVRSHLKSALDAHKTFETTFLYRKGGRLGPNAFALPAGTIVFTDELIKIAKHDDELLAIMVHEIGHLVHQHAMRRIIQDSLLSFALLALTGDASGVSELFLGLPVILTEMSYSRDFEREADQYALNYMQDHKVSLNRFADILLRIEKNQKKKKEGKVEEGRWMGYLSTHPPTPDRVKVFRDTSSGDN
ncbi:MAG: M48 family metallopeptidase [Desulfobacterales bacterium]|nr:M48 family metallopeptidase [Desulfobacterales bacterium]